MYVCLRNNNFGAGLFTSTVTRHQTKFQVVHSPPFYLLLCERSERKPKGNLLETFLVGQQKKTGSGFKQRIRLGQTGLVRQVY